MFIGYKQRNRQRDGQTNCIYHRAPIVAESEPVQGFFCLMLVYFTKRIQFLYLLVKIEKLNPASPTSKKYSKI